jgi:hypothetical protein
MSILTPLTVRLATTDALAGKPVYEEGEPTLDGGTGLAAQVRSQKIGTLVIDGETVLSGDRILVKNELDPIVNGIYTVLEAGSKTAPWQLMRASEFDNSVSGQVVPGVQITATSGSANSGHTFRLQGVGTGGANAFLIGMDPMHWAPVAGSATLDITPSPRLLQVLGDIPLQPWQCLAELVDNSLDELLKSERKDSDSLLTVDIHVEQESGETYLLVSDNGLGMSVEELERSLRAGHSAKNRYGSLGLFGMGFNIATARLGNVTTVSTTQLGMPERIEATIDFAEIQRRESFTVPMKASACDSAQSGTTVKVKLKADMAGTFKRKSTQQTLAQQLGDVYSYLLRDDVPGLTNSAMSARIPARLQFNGEPVQPRLPCVWSDQRSVTSYGQPVSAIQYIDRKLTAATACLDCGYWDRKNGPEICEECGSLNLQVRERRIWGWIGIQRYIDSQEYGIDFIRYGRKILKQDKSIFVFTNPDTLRSDAEYPIEMPANQGRIVGEIHLDHVPVTYQKNDFDRQSRDWQTAVEIIRGTGPLKPQSSSEVNDSPLAKLFTAYRRNDAGLRNLIPGDGKGALHAKTREWAIMFHKGIPRLRDDTEWYEAAQRHTQIKENAAGGGEVPIVLDPGGNGAVIELIGVDTPETSLTEGEDKVVTKPITQSDKFAAARLLGIRRDDLSGTFKLGKDLGTWEVTVVVTRDTLQDEFTQDVPALPGVIKGHEIEVFVSGEHVIFREFGRDVRDVALMQAAVLIHDLSGSKQSSATVYGELVKEVEDLRITTPQILDRIDRTLDRIRALALPIIGEDPADFWSALDASDKTAIEERGAVKFSAIPFPELVGDGRFIVLCDAHALVKLIKYRPGSFFDGSVFSPSLSLRQGMARDRIVGSLTRSLESTAAFKDDEMMREKHDVQLVLISLDYLDENVITEELLA